MSLFLFSGVLKCWCGTMPPSFHKLLNETVTTFAVFPSWMNLLDGEDNCMLSVPFSTSDLHFSCWQSGENCQAVAAGAFMLLVFLQRRVLSLLFCLVVLLTRLSARCLPSSWPDTASFRSCLLLPPGFLDTREAGICAGSRAWSSFFFLV